MWGNSKTASFMGVASLSICFRISKLFVSFKMGRPMDRAGLYMEAIIKIRICSRKITAQKLKGNMKGK